MSKLGTPTYEAEIQTEDSIQLLTYDYFRQFYKVLSKHSKIKIREMRQKDYLKQRREALKNQQQAIYKQLVLDLIEDEERLQSSLLQEGCRLVSLSEEVFISSLQYYTLDSFVKQDLFKIGLYNQINSALLSKFSCERIKEIFMASENERINYLQEHGQIDDFSIDSLTSVMISKAILSDSIYDKWGIEEEEL
jgi:hypothetical protein